MSRQWNPFVKDLIRTLIYTTCFFPHISHTSRIPMPVALNCAATRRVDESCAKYKRP